MLGAACYAFRYTELLERYCGGSLALGCDWEQLREHYEKVGRAESRTYGCAGITASDLNATGAAAIGSMLAVPHAVSQEQVRLLPRRCQQYHGTLDAHAGSKKNEPHPFMHELHPPPPLASRRCMAWPIELQERLSSRRRPRQRSDAVPTAQVQGEVGGSGGRSGRGGRNGRGGRGGGSHAPSRGSSEGINSQAEADQIKTEMAQLAEHWLRPFRGGVGREHVHPSSQSRDTDLGGEEWRMCSLVQVVDGKIYMQLSPRALIFPRIHFGNCGHNDSENGRTLTMLRLLQVALRHPGPGAGGSWPDFEFRLCGDDYCHGLAEGADRAFFTSSVCATKRTLPGVQWNPSGGRDVDLALWDETMARRRRLREVHDEHWACRLPMAVWRGDAHNHQVYNEFWTDRGELSRQKMRSERWTRQGRLALVHQKCSHPSLLNVRVKLLTPGGKFVPFHWDRTNGTPPGMAYYNGCVRAVNKDKPKFIPMAEQSARFQMAVHVEGNGGWADRLRHLLLSGMVVLRQQMGVAEWWEAGLEPWVHYVPVSSTLHNLSDAVWWVRNNSAQAREIAVAAARLVERALSTRALEAYAVALYSGYAGLYRAPPPQLASPPQRFECHLVPNVESEFGKGNFTATDCGFATTVDNESVFAPSLFEIEWRRHAKQEQLNQVQRMQNQKERSILARLLAMVRSATRSERPAAPRGQQSTRPPKGQQRTKPLSVRAQKSKKR